MTIEIPQEIKKLIKQYAKHGDVTDISKIINEDNSKMQTVRNVIANGWGEMDIVVDICRSLQTKEISYTTINRRFKIKIKIMETYKITFLTLDGNTQEVFVDAISPERAILKFENEYQYEAIKYCEEQTN